MQLQIETTEKCLLLISTLQTNGIEILLAIGRTDQNTTFCVHTVFVQVAVVESFKETEQDRQQASCGFVHLVVVSVGYDCIDLSIRTGIQPCLVDEDDAIVNLVTQLQNRIQSPLAFSVVLVDDAFERNVTV